MMSLYEELTGRKPTSQIVPISGEAFYGSGYEDSSRLPPDVSKMRSLGWTPRHDVRTTLLDAMRYYLCDQRVISGVEVA
jgi:nucleoside-diphosphate-sugar epimerase